MLSLAHPAIRRIGSPRGVGGLGSSRTALNVETGRSPEYSTLEIPVIAALCKHLVESWGKVIDFPIDNHLPEMLCDSSGDDAHGCVCVSVQMQELRDCSNPQAR